MLFPDYVMNQARIPRCSSIRFTSKTWEFPADDQVANTGRKMRLSTRSFRVNLRGEHVIRFLKQFLRRTAGPIVLVWDNHPIHQRRLVQNFIESEPRLHVFAFPTCAPELNPMEFV